MKQDFQFPAYMLRQKRWMARTRGTKLPFSVLDDPPTDVKDKAWRYQWNRRSVWSNFETAFAFLVEEPTEVEGLCYVLHPAGEEKEQLRLVCLDFDKCIKDGACDSDVLQLTRELNTFVELSKNGNGVHVFGLVRCKPFKNALQRDFGSCKVDVLCSAQVAVTGTIFESFDTLREIPFDVINQFQLKDQIADDVDRSDAWSEEFDPVGPIDYLVDHMTTWPLCARSTKGSQLGEGGDVEMYRAACHLARHGVTGETAVELLQLVPADPEFTESELRHKVECAFRSVHDAEDCFGEQSAQNEFDVIEGYVPPSDDDKTRTRYGFLPIRLDKLEEMDLEVGFVVKSLLVDREGLFIGGREKSFKTGIAADLALSLSTGVPFLNRFEVLCERKTVSFFTAEIGLPTAQTLFSRIRRAKGLPSGAIKSVDIIESLPTFQLHPHTGKPVDPLAITGLRQYFEDRRPDVAVFDPLYLAMTGASVGDMYAIGGVLNNMAMVCREFGIWPVFCHHAKKDPAKEYQPMELTDFYGSGVSAFARQWMLMSHAEPFEGGRASLYCNAGGSAAGDCGLWRVNIFEGQSDEILDRKWDVVVEDERNDGGNANEEEVLQALRYFCAPESIQSIATYAELDASLTKKILVRLVKEDKATLVNNKFQIGS